MSVTYEPKLTIGWRVDQEDIPDFEERLNEDWSELEGLAQTATELLGELVWQSELCEVEDSWTGYTQIVGVPMFDHELPVEGSLDQTDTLADFAEKVYRKVMRKEPEDGPYLISWTQVS